MEVGVFVPDLGRHRAQEDALRRRDRGAIRDVRDRDFRIEAFVDGRPGRAELAVLGVIVLVLDDQHGAGGNDHDAPIEILVIRGDEPQPELRRRRPGEGRIEPDLAQRRRLSQRVIEGVLEDARPDREARPGHDETVA